eukprot:CAMPEP_0197577378 /NCGR_PEP_ID=MMETSP1326-20131121/2032_1 /TAXON_ID=1155430 /ORGANISM="Genus nov. species nov., Strain RCC2288" /LENGTH=186 /DNA_ID=CAMNT_0043140437 /DNA_START=33 /DNA_END=590 /DNA_ORIENTATION=-
MATASRAVLSASAWGRLLPLNGPGRGGVVSRNRSSSKLAASPASASARGFNNLGRVPSSLAIVSLAIVATPRGSLAAAAASPDGIGASLDTMEPSTDVVVAIVTTTSCPHCRRAKAALKTAAVAFEEIDVSDGGALMDAATTASGMRTVPQVFVGGSCFGGADDLEAGIASGAFLDTVRATAADAA